MANVQLVERPEAKRLRYVVRWRVDGQDRTKGFPTKKAATAYQAQLITAIDTGTYHDPKRGAVTLDAYTDEWWQRQLSWVDSTTARQQSVYRNHIAPTFGNRRLANIRRSDIERWAADLTQGDNALAPTTANGAIALLAHILKTAARDQRIPTNPAEAVGRHPTRSPDRDPLTIPQVQTLAEHINPRLSGAVLIAAATGLRQAELFGLTVSDVDTRNRELKIDRQLVTAAGPPQWRELKTPASRRTIKYTAVADLIDTHVDEAETRGPAPAGRADDTRFLFVNQRGRHYRRNNASSAFRTAVRRSGLDPKQATGWHALRHHHASILIRQGQPVTAVAAVLGHTPATPTPDGSTQRTKRPQTPTPKRSPPKRNGEKSGETQTENILQ